MNLLLDTHAVMWWLFGDTRLSKRARSAIDEYSEHVFVSAVSVWEVATKFRLGKLPSAAPIHGNLVAAISSQSFRPLDLSLTHAHRAGALPGPHNDPFDRMLIAQAQLEGFVLVSNEKVFDSYGITRLW